MELSIKEQNLRRYRTALSKADTIEHRVLLTALIHHLEGQDAPEGQAIRSLARSA